ncbi:aldo/keto reductase [Stenotrophomonas lacuserhaii]|uniref:aldo/keto reductase n=1 Tax=Stenotrophomonas lacuserhaii TaxID=2760084 RepID=UPI0032EEC2A8
MPILGFGVYQMTDAQCEASVLEALRIGYRLIDTAAIYGNEEAVGRAIRASGVPRQELFVTTKLWVSDAGEASAIQAFEASLGRLGLNYLDLYLIHQPFGDVHGAWRAMETLQRDGRARSIGVSNFQPDRVMDLIVTNQIPPAVNQIELHPFHAQSAAVEFLQENGVQTQSWGPFAEGKNDIFNNPVLTGVATKHGRSVAQVILRWLIQRDIVVIPKSVTPARIRENFEVFSFELDTQDMQQIATLDQGTSAFFDHRDPAIVKWLGARPS